MQVHFCGSDFANRPLWPQVGFVQLSAFAYYNTFCAIYRLFCIKFILKAVKARSRIRRRGFYSKVSHLLGGIWGKAAGGADPYLPQAFRTSALGLKERFSLGCYNGKLINALSLLLAYKDLLCEGALYRRLSFSLARFRFPFIIGVFEKRIDTWQAFSPSLPISRFR